MDLIYVLDSSGSIGIVNWGILLSFVQNVTALLDIGPNAARVGIVSYGNEANLQFDLNTFSTMDEILEAIGNT